MPINIHGKEYKTVAERISEFRHDYSSDLSIETEVLSNDDRVIVKATIRNEHGRVISTGLAEELRGSTNINKTSALENAETSAVGRALAFFGLGGTEIASADEVANAITQQKEMEAVERIVRHNNAVREWMPSILAIKEALANNDLSLAAEAWYEMDKDTMSALWLAPTNGGIFTTKEREIMKSAEFRKAHYGEETK